MYRKKKPEDLDCGIEVSVKVFAGKWKPCLIESINQGNHRPSEIHRSILSAAPRVLNMQLKELENFKVVRKKIYPGLPPRVEYYLTDLGKSILPIVAMLDQWGTKHKEEIKRINETLKLLNSIG
ncbi:MAG TPA: helix-turn-helix domain-containing protein [Chryseolinea sp.]|nr:helix-turn-helix domain-containing protein [Chryseolinea sp.]